MFKFWENTFCLIAPIMFWGVPEYSPAAEITIDFSKKSKKENKIKKTNRQVYHSYES